MQTGVTGYNDGSLNDTIGREEEDEGNEGEENEEDGGRENGNEREVKEAFYSCLPWIERQLVKVGKKDCREGKLQQCNLATN